MCLLSEIFIEQQISVMSKSVGEAAISRVGSHVERDRSSGP
jgi:hypothetical protein